MDRLAIQSWFSGLSRTDKVIVLLNIMHELTIVVRELFLTYEHDCETKARLAYKVSELNHRLTAAASAFMEGRPTFPDNVLIEMLLDQPSYPELAPYGSYVLERAVELLNSRDARST